MLELDLHKSCEYTIPSFSVVTVSLRHAVVQGHDDEGDLMVADVFFRNDSSLSAAIRLPQYVRVYDTCFVEVSLCACTNLVSCLKII